MKITITLLALAVGSYEIEAGYPFFGYAIIAAALWESWLEPAWHAQGSKFIVFLRRSGAVAFLSVIALLALVTDLKAADIRPTLDIREVSVQVTWVETREQMRRELLRVGRSPATELDLAVTKAFSQLLRNTETGEYVCRIFAFKPDRVDGDRVLSLGHELSHCLLGEYHL